MKHHESFSPAGSSLIAAFVSGLLLLFEGGPAFQAAPNISKPPVEIVLVESAQATTEAIARWKAEGFKGVALVLDDPAKEGAIGEAARRVLAGGLDLYWWIEVARNAKLAAAHPRWMAALGAHDDWQKNFPDHRERKFGEVAKAYPWVPICYREGFDAQLARVEGLLNRLPAGWRGVLLNDLQAGPSSCGCGNSQCRWAVDYHVHPTATKMEGNDVAVQFLSEIRRRVPGKEVIPAWTTECEEVDLPADKHQGRPGTGLCGTVGCATGTCPDMFSRQWTALESGHSGPIALLGLHRAFQRTRTEFGGGPSWLTNALAYLEKTVPAHDGKAVPKDRLWIVVEGDSAAEEASARKVAAESGVGAIIVARTRIDQSYEPRMIHTE
jgi:hypothetical protein